MQDQTGASAISLGGGGVRSNNYLLDGFPVTDLQNRSSTNPSGEMVEDVRVQVHTYDAEMGRTGGGVLNTTAKSGANSFRGSALLPGSSERVDRSAVLQSDPRHRELAAVLARGRRRLRRSRSCTTRRSSGSAGEGYRDGLSQNAVHDRADTGVAQRRLQQLRRCAGPPDPDLRPADDGCQRQSAAVPGQHHPAEPHQPVGARVPEGDSAALDRSRRPASATCRRRTSSTTRRSRAR